MASSGSDIRQQIAEIVQGHITRTGTNVAQLAVDTGIPRTTLQRRLAGAAPFTVDELAAVADRFHVELVDLVSSGRSMAAAS